MKAILITIALLTVPSACFAQSGSEPAKSGPLQGHKTTARPIELAELESLALQGNPDIKTAERRVATADARVSGAGSLEDPQLMYRGWGVPFRKPWNYNQAENMFMVSQSFPGKGKRLLRSQVAGQEVEVAKAELEGAKREVLVQVRTAYYQLLRTYDEVRLHHEEVALARQAAESARIKYTVGRVPQQDVLKAQTALTKLVRHLIDFETTAELARAQLNALMGRDPDHPLEVTGEYSLPAHLPSLSELKRTALENRPELAAVRASIAQQSLQVRLASKAYTPDLTVSAGYMLMPSGSQFRNNYMAELTVNLPWLNKRKHDSEISVANAEVAGRQAELERLQTAVFLDIQQALIRANAARKAIKLYTDTLRPQAQATLKATVAAYETDRTDFLNLLDSQAAALDVEYEYYRVVTEFDLRLADLERAVGAPVSRKSPSISGSEVRP